MKPYFQIKGALKDFRWRLRRAQAAAHWGSTTLASAPAVLGNAMPKSGSHLIIQVLQGLTRIGPFVNPGFPPVNRGEDNSILTDEQALAHIERMRPGDIAYSYLQARPPFLQAVTRPGMAMVFVYRDPRDMLVSHVFYATQIHKGHNMHRYYTEVLQNMEQRLDAAIHGVDEPGSPLSGVRAKYDKYLGWLETPGVLCLRFEELILDREAALGRLLAYLEARGFTPTVPQEQAIEALKAAILPKKSGTFRKASPGNWREHFTPANRQAFKAATGDLLVRLGYEKDDAW